MTERAKRRLARDFQGADAIRDQLRGGGWDVVDGPSGSELVPRPLRRAVTLLTIVHGWRADAERWLLSVFTHTRADFEVVLVDNSGDQRIAGWLKTRAAERLRVITLDPPQGFGAAVNAGVDVAEG